MKNVKQHTCPVCGADLFYRQFNDRAEYVLWMSSKNEEKYPEKPVVRFRGNTATVNLTIIPLFTKSYETFIEMLRRRK